MVFANVVKQARIKKLLRAEIIMDLLKRIEMKILNNYSFAVLLCATMNAWAGSEGSQPTIALTVPELKPGIEFSGFINWLQPNNGDNLIYAVLTDPLPSYSPHWQNEALSPGYRIGFNVGVRYIFNQSGHDAQLDWTSFRSNTNDAITAPSNQGVPPPFAYGPEGYGITTASSNVNFQYNDVNLDVGQYLQFGNNLMLRFFGGLSYAQITQNWNSTFYAQSDPLFRLNMNTSSAFNGTGPQD